MHANSSVDTQEIAKFDQHAKQWWDIDGPLKTLHDINETRLKFIESTQPLSGLRVLDVGCGGGILTEGLARHNAIVTGLDVAADAIRVAQEHAKASQLPISYICEPIEQYRAEPFSCITCLEMLEHVTQPSLIIEHAARLLQSGGYLFLSTINRTAKAYATVILAGEYLLNLLPRQTHDYTKFIKPSELAQITRAAGLELVSLQGMGYHPFLREATLIDSVAVNYLMACRKA